MLERPKFIVPNQGSDGTMLFLAGNDELEIDAEHEEVINTLAQAADGRTSYDEVLERVKLAGIDVEVARLAMEDLVTLGIIIDATEQHVSFHELTKNPSIYERGLTAAEILEITSRPMPPTKDGVKVDLPNGVDSSVGRIAERRESVRHFSDKVIEIGKLAEVLANTYSLERSPIPSAGGLYPLRIFMVVKPGQEIPEGNYQFDATDGSLVRYDDEFDQDRLAHVVNEEEALHGAPVVVVIAADMKRHNEKYSNRGYRYTVLEAGHAAQNLHLTATELGLGSIEYGGFSDDGINDYLGLDEDVEPIIVLGFGYERTDEDIAPTTYERLNVLETAYVENGPVNLLGVQFIDREFDAPFYVAKSDYDKPNDAYGPNSRDRTSGGVANSAHMAQIKAVAEAYERYVSGVVKIDFTGSADDIEGEWLDPRIIRALDEGQYNLMPHLQTFGTNKVIDWVEAEKFDGGKVLVPVDLVYYPLNEHVLGRKAIAESDSSGVAAFTDFKTAAEKALYELIERDALMRCWINQEKLSVIGPEHLSDAIKKRIELWDSKGFDMKILDLSTDVPIVQVVIVNKDDAYPYFVNGAAAANTFEDAVAKAAQEAELGLIDALESDEHELMNADHVYTPADHGVFYLHPENAKYIKWLWENSETAAPHILNHNVDIFAKYDPLVVKLNHGWEPLSVVRVITPHLVPISFGTGTEYYSHQHGTSDKPAHIGQAPHFFA